MIQKDKLAGSTNTFIKKNRRVCKSDKPNPQVGDTSQAPKFLSRQHQSGLSLAYAPRLGMRQPNHTSPGVSWLVCVLLLISRESSKTRRPRANRNRPEQEEGFQTGIKQSCNKKL